MDASPLAAAARALTASPLAAAAALAACALLAALLARRLLSAAALSREYTAFRVVSRAVANRGERPVVFLTIRTSTAALPTGAHVKVRARVGGALVVRSYTPTKFDAGECELMFRVYEGGPMSTHLAALRVGDAVEMMGPTGIERYAPRGPGTFSRGGKEWAGITHVALVGGGTGVTPLLQIINHVLADPADATRLRLVAFATAVDDFVLEDRVRALARGSRGALSAAFVASRAPPRGAPPLPADVVAPASMRDLSAAALRDLLGVPAGRATMVCVCGPDGFAERAKALLAPHFENVIVW